MRGTLIVAVLTTSSSYSRDVSEDVKSGRVPDTIQWWLGESNWRIRTFGLDHDIHVLSLGFEISVEDAMTNTQKHYGDIVGSEFQIAFEDIEDSDQAMREIKAAHPEGVLEIAAPQFAFWKPDDARYRSQSRPS